MRATDIVYAPCRAPPSGFGRVSLSFSEAMRSSWTMLVDEGGSRQAAPAVRVLRALYLRCLFAEVNGGDHGAVPGAHRQIDSETIL